jgi:hypothetical protein
MENGQDSVVAFDEMVPLNAPISREEALGALCRRRPGTAMSEISSVRYGLLRVENRSQQFPEGRAEPPIWEWPVWVITLPRGWWPRGRAMGPQPLSCVLDAESGEYLFAFH